MYVYDDDKQDPQEHELLERLAEIDRIDAMVRDGQITNKQRFEYFAALAAARA